MSKTARKLKGILNKESCKELVEFYDGLNKSEKEKFDNELEEELHKQMKIELFTSWKETIEQNQIDAPPKFLEALDKELLELLGE